MKQSLFLTWTRTINWPAICLVIALGCSSSSAGQEDAVQDLVNSTTSGTIRVVGNQLMRDGLSWTPHGLNLIAFVQPPAAQPGGCNGTTSGVFQTAWNRYETEGAKLFTDLMLWGADSIRFQVSQQGIDRNSRIYSQAFFDSFVNAVHQARSAGLVVIVSIQDECQSGDPTTAKYPDVENEHVWNELAPLFKSDLGIMFEIYNEPEPAATPANWRTWRTRFNRAISHIRSTGATNVVIADGLAFATTLKAAPTLDDPASQVAYAVHPYFHKADLNAVFWEDRFGYVAIGRPVIVTEWTSVANAAKSGSSYYCDANTPAQASLLMEFLQRHRIGMLGFAWDFTGGVFGSVVFYDNASSSSFTNSSFASTECGQFGFGPGNTMQSWFQTGTVPGTPQ